MGTFTPSSRYLVAVSVILLICGFQLFEYTTTFPSQSPHVPPLGSGKSKAYRLVDDFSAESFFDGFNFEDAPDPTHGHVKYQSRSEAVRHNLTYLGDDGISYIHVDHHNRAPEGRRAVRISSKKQYTTGLVVLDLHHMPEGCGTWPAFWTTAPSSWPSKGEIDILEGVNLETDNAFTLHTGPGCSVSAVRDQLGTTETTNCDINAWGQWPNQGCGVKTRDSFGKKFNDAGGGVVVMQWRAEAISMWIFKRGEVPRDVSDGEPVPDTDSSAWGMPDATFDNTDCDIEKIFRDHVIIINTTFCGDWAGTVYGQSSCPGTDCVAFVSDHPEAFVDAYWAIKSLRVYQ